MLHSILVQLRLTTRAVTNALSAMSMAAWSLKQLNLELVYNIIMSFNFTIIFMTLVMINNIMVSIAGSNNNDSYHFHRSN